MRTPATVADEDRVVAALLRLAERFGSDERAAYVPPEIQAAESDADREAERIARDHGITSSRLVPLRSLAVSRNVPLETVLRAWMRGDLASIVRLPENRVSR